METCLRRLVLYSKIQPLHRPDLWMHWSDASVHQDTVMHWKVSELSTKELAQYLWYEQLLLTPEQAQEIFDLLMPSITVGEVSSLSF